ncbi:hypothetical protein [Variovorax paradoxus]|uniref:hypothetical protein n=1 Tax=Variovorax paradoxus TaxID=34073 RepID=UPI001D176D7F|nr:hypothetical protein [Variovorax paradoxus]
MIYLFEHWLGPQLDSGALEPIPESPWLRFSGPFSLLPRPPAAGAAKGFVDFIQSAS